MPDEAKADLDQLVQQLKADRTARSSRSKDTPTTRARRRSTTSWGSIARRAVKRYLYEQHQVPLHKISVISYGEEKPIAPNKTKEGRAQNRRVVIKVLT